VLATGKSSFCNVKETDEAMTEFIFSSTSFMYLCSSPVLSFPRALYSYS